MKKHFFYLIAMLALSLTSYAQKKDCQIDYEIKNDTLNLVKTQEHMLYEKDFGRTTKSIFMSLAKVNDIYVVQMQYLQKDVEFIPITCVNYKSLVSIKLLNGKIVNLHYVGDEKCDTLMYDDQEKNNIRILTTDFVLRKEDIPLLKESPITTMQIRFSNKTDQFIIREDINSQITKTTAKPSQFFINNLDCIE